MLQFGGGDPPSIWARANKAGTFDLDVPTFTKQRLLRNLKACCLNREMLYFALDLTTTCEQKRRVS